MKNTFIALLSILIFNTSFSQDVVKMKVESGTENNDLRDIIQFENININRFEFTSKSIIGKNYKIDLIEYKEGKQVSTTQLFESSSLDLFRVKEKKFKFRILTKFIDKTKLKIEIKFDRFGSRPFFFDLIDNKFGYTMKDFQGSKKETEIPLENEFYLTSIISPTVHKDGSASYCEVVLTKNPENIGEEFKIPHYFLIRMKFTK
jgi:hypothetical protein